MNKIRYIGKEFKTLGCFTIHRRIVGLNTYKYTVVFKNKAISYRKSLTSLKKAEKFIEDYLEENFKPFGKVLYL